MNIFFHTLEAVTVALVIMVVFRIRYQYRLALEAYIQLKETEREKRITAQAIQPRLPAQESLPPSDVDAITEEFDNAPAQTGILNDYIGDFFASDEPSHFVNDEKPPK